MALATTLGRSASVPEIKRAIGLEPSDADLHFRLGTAEIYSMGNSDAADGIHQLQRATQLSPDETRYWTALAFACEFEGEAACADKAIARSLALSPMVPQVHWEAASFYLRINRQESALNQFRRLVELDPNYDGPVFRASLGATESPNAVYQNVVTPAASPKLKLAYVEFLANNGHGNSAFHVWQELAAGGLHLKFSLADPYLEHLIDARRYQQAMAVWRDLIHQGIVQQAAGKDPANLVFNGGFEQVPLNAGFDWRYNEVPYVAVDFRDRHAYKGKYSLQLDFTDVENHQDEPVYQFVPVAADQAYELTAYIRSANITSDSGPRLRVVDPECPKCLDASSKATVGTTPWHKVVLDFHTGPNTRVVRLSVWRPRSLNYPAEILGTLWLDQVSIRAISPPAGQTAQRSGI